jgi:hypothetical protein
MTQHDLTIANGPGVDVRLDLQLALQAISTMQEGPTAPPTTYPLQLWADTTSGFLKIRNQANTGWIIWAPIDASQIPAGGLAGQVLGKLSANDLDTGWIAPLGVAPPDQVHMRYGTGALGAQNWIAGAPLAAAVGINDGWAMTESDRGRAMFSYGTGDINVTLPDFPPTAGWYAYYCGGQANTIFKVPDDQPDTYIISNNQQLKSLWCNLSDRGLLIQTSAAPPLGWIWIGQRHYVTPPATPGVATEVYPHSLGVNPNRCRLRLTNAIADLGYSVGTMIYPIACAQASGAAGQNTGVQLMASSTSISIRYGDRTAPSGGCLQILDASGKAAGITPGNWTATVRAEVDN